ncbi:MAG: hypothetical protein AAAC47_17765 [Pararhizobium sp.]
MADRPRIGNPLPRGVVDISHDFIGVPSQGVNPKKELARLRKQVASLRAGIEAQGVSGAKPAKLTAFYVAAAAVLGAILLAWMTLRSGRI